MVIAKLDYLSRNAAFLLALRDSGEKFVPFDMLVPNDLTVGFMALVAEAGRDSISWRTKVSLASVNARGVKLGKPNGAESLKRARKGGAALQAVVGVKADQFARDLEPVIADIRRTVYKSLRAMTAELTAQGIRTQRGGVYWVSKVRGLL